MSNYQQKISGNFTSFINQIIFLLKVYFTFLLVFFIFRLFWFINFGNEQIWTEKLDFLKACFVGIGFDTIMFTYLFIPFFLFLLIRLLLPIQFPITTSRISVIYSIIMMLVVLIISIINCNYFIFFSTPIDNAFWNFLTDDTNAIMASIWKDFPIIITIIILIFIELLFYFMFRFYQKKVYKIKIVKGYLKIFIIFFIIVVYLFGMRFTLRAFSYSFLHAETSKNRFINYLPMNALYLFYRATNDKLKQTDYDFSDYKYWAKYYTSDDTLIYKNTAYNIDLEENPPNVVVIQMEAMSSYFLKLHSEKFNLIGSLSDELPNCISFPNFLSCKDFTKTSMDGIILHSPIDHLNLIRNGNRSYSTSSINPFFEKGYKTMFLTSGRLNWHNIENFYSKQGFEYFEGDIALKENFPNAEEGHAWGVYDEVLMDRIFQILEQSNSKPIFIYGMTITNHTPYQLPKSYKTKPIIWTDELKQLIKNEDNTLQASLLSHQYMCDKLGILLNKIRTSKVGENTIIVITGDHNPHINGQVFGFSIEDIMNWRGVPLIMYIPDKYKQKLHIDTTRFASHKDIFKTIFHLSLSNATFYDSGNNLFANDESTNYFALYQYNTAVNKEGAVIFSKNNPSKFLKWKDKNFHRLEFIETPTPPLQRLDSNAATFVRKNTYQIIRQLQGKN